MPCWEHYALGSDLNLIILFIWIISANKKSFYSRNFEEADEEIRTLDILLGKEMLYH